MASIKVIFRASPSEGHEGVLYYRIIHQRRIRQIHTECKVLKAEWDVESDKVALRGSPKRINYLMSIQRAIDDGVSRLMRIADELAKSGQTYSVDDIVSRYLAASSIPGFVSFSRQYIGELRLFGRLNRVGHYTTSLNSLLRFNGSGEIPWNEFTDNFIQAFEQYLRRRGLAANSTSFYMRNLRAIYNQAVERELTLQTNPFKHVYTGIAKTAKRSVPLSAIKALKRLNLSNDSMLELARDLFLFSFFTRGMAIIDVAFLRKDNIKNGILTYCRRKTGQRLRIRWEPQMQDIVSRYADNESEYLFPLIDSRKPDCRRQYLNAYNRLNRHLQKLGAMLGLSEPLTFHRSRHSWASIARENNVPLSVICEGMGHDSEKTTRIYLASLESSAVDEANSALIELLER